MPTGCGNHQPMEALVEEGIFYLRPYVPRMILGVTIKFTGTIMDLFLPWILSYLIDVIVPKKIWGNFILRFSYAGLFRYRLDRQRSCQPDGSPRGQGYNPAHAT